MKKNILWAMALTCAALGMTTSCSDDDNESKHKEEEEKPITTQDVTGEVSGVWTKNSIINVTGHITVPKGQSLTIQEGVNVIFASQGVGVNHVPVEFTVDGSLYIQGTEANPVLLSTEEANRTAANTFAGLWGGIVATENCPEMLIDHAIIEYTGGQVIEGSPAATNGIYTAGGDAYPQITTTNMDGSYVITNCTIRNGWSDGIYLMGGKAIVSGNTFSANGYDGAEAVNVKAGTVVDVCDNVMFSPNTNGLKMSSAGQSETRCQAHVQAYNNTIINAGWRRDGEKGGCIYAEKNVLVNIFNNLMVNCKFRAQTPKYKDPNNTSGGYDSNSVIDYNYYASGSQKSDIVYTEESGVAYAWEGYNYDNKNYYTKVVDVNSIIATEANGRDPKFVNFPINDVALTSYSYDSSWDFHLQAGSPALQGAYAGTDSNMAPNYATTGLSVGGKTYTSPAAQAHFGVYGTK